MLRRKHISQLQLPLCNFWPIHRWLNRAIDQGAPNALRGFFPSALGIAGSDAYIYLCKYLDNLALIFAINTWTRLSSCRFIRHCEKWKAPVGVVLAEWKTRQFDMTVRTEQRKAHQNVILSQMTHAACISDESKRKAAPINDGKPWRSINRFCRTNTLAEAPIGLFFRLGNSLFRIT